MAAGTKVLLIGFGGPRSPEEIRPFIVEVLEGRPVPEPRIEEVAEHYRMLGGRSPYVDETLRLGVALEGALAGAGRPRPVIVGMRKGFPRLDELLAAETDEGTSRLIAVALSPQEGRYARDRYLRDLDRLIDALGSRAPRVAWTRSFHDHPGFLSAWTDRIRSAPGGASAGKPGGPHIIFTAHSVPTPGSDIYREQVLGAAGAIARSLSIERGGWSLAWQSRSGRPTDPWLEPDICDEITRLAGAGVRSALAAPIGFLCDHVEVLYDLGVEAREAAARSGLDFQVVPSLGTHPDFVAALAGLVEEADR